MSDPIDLDALERNLCTDSWNEWSTLCEANMPALIRELRVAREVVWIVRQYLKDTLPGDYPLDWKGLEAALIDYDLVAYAAGLAPKEDCADV